MIISAAHEKLLIFVIIFVIQQHFRFTLWSYNQSDTFNNQTIFIRSAAIEKVVMNIKDVKLDINVSTIHFTLLQTDTKRVVEYASWVHHLHSSWSYNWVVAETWIWISKRVFLIQCITFLASKLSLLSSQSLRITQTLDEWDLQFSDILKVFSNQLYTFNSSRRFRQHWRISQQCEWDSRIQRKDLSSRY